MIPLKSSQSVEKISSLCVLVIALWFLTQILHWIFGTSFIESFAFYPQTQNWFAALKSVLIHETFFDTLFSSLYFWVFAIPAFNIFKPFLLLTFSIFATLATAYLFALIHPYSNAPILFSPAFLGFILGAFMRRDIWGNVDTLVIGFPLKPQVYSVPSYVLLFFWFFYLLIANILMDSPFSDAPMLYLVPLFGFLLGFVYASVKCTHAIDKRVTS